MKHFGHDCDFFFNEEKVFLAAKDALNIDSYQICFVLLKVGKKELL